MMRKKRLPALLSFALLLVFLLVGCDYNRKEESTEPGFVDSEETEKVDEETMNMLAIHETREEITVVKTTNPRTLTDGVEYTGEAVELFAFKLSEGYQTTQGAYFDGEYFYVAETRYDENRYETVSIVVLDTSGNIVRCSDGLPLDHANNITYNSKLDKLVVTHCQSPDDHFYRYSMVDPETFEITETADKANPFFAMSYSPELDQYASGQWSGQTIDIWDGEMNNILSRRVETPASLSQGVCCDGDYIYFVRSSQNGAPAEIRIYNWEAELVRTVVLSFEDSLEPENINIVDGVTYVICNDHVRGMGVCYTLVFNIVEE